MFDEPNSLDPLVGRTFGDKFLLRRCIGEGASGTVYEAVQTALGRRVAVKVLHADLSDDDRLTNRFQGEAVAASRLNHPNTVAVIDYGQTDDGLLYIVMEYLRGRTLTEVIREEGQLETPRLVSLMEQILEGLDEAHAAGVIHADLKADNVVVETRRNGRENAKVVDFGIARLVGRPSPHQDADTICGTPEYMAPEVITGGEPTAASDVYAAGCLLYELLTGKTPFGHSTGTMEVLTQQLRETPVRPTEAAPDRDIPEELANAAMVALAKEPGARHGSAAEFRDALVATLSGRARRATGERGDVLCPGCGVWGPAEFKFCPECGHPRAVPRSPRQRTAPITGPGFSETLPTTPHADPLMGTSPTLVDQESGRIVAKGLSIEFSDGGTIASGRPTTLDDTRGAGIFPLAFVGRGNEFAIVRHFMASPEAGGTLALIGPSGSGRSRLVREVCEELAVERLRVYLAEADPQAHSSPLYPVRSVIATLLELPPVCPYDGLREAVERLGLTERDAPGIGELFGYESDMWELDAPVRRRELMASTIRALRAEAERHPIVLVFEDIDRYDAPSRELLARISEVADSDLRLLVTSDSAIEWEGVERVEIQGLDQPALASLASFMAASGNQAMPDADAVERMSEGNPAYIHQLARYVTEGGDADLAPPTTADLIAERLEFLPRDALYVLQAAAVLGHEALAEHIEAVLKLREPDLHAIDRALAVLEARAMVAIEGQVVVFPQRVVREVTYEATPADVRRELHRAACSVLEPIGDPAVLGHHLELAGDLQSAALQLAAAGDAWVHQLDDAGACSLYNRALSAARAVMLGDDAAELRTVYAEVSIKLAEALRIGGQVGLARGVVDEARSYCRGVPELEAQIDQAMAHVLLAEGDLSGAAQAARAGIGQALAAGKPELLAELYLDLSAVLMRDGRGDLAIAELDEAINLLTMGEGERGQSGPRTMWRLLFRLSQLHRAGAQPDRALALAEAGLAHAGRVKSRIGRARLHALLAELLEALGEEQRAADYREAAVEDMRRLGDRRGTAELLLASASPTRTLIRIQAGALREARELAREIGWSDGAQAAQRSLDHEPA